MKKIIILAVVVLLAVSLFGCAEKKVQNMAVDSVGNDIGSGLSDADELENDVDSSGLDSIDTDLDFSDL